MVVKESPARTAGRRIADRLRGSAARRAWSAAYGLEARRIPTAKALAFLEEATLGFPRRSVLFAERLDALDPLELVESNPEACVDALVDALLAMHRRGVDHGDLKVTNLPLVRSDGGALRASAIDLDGTRFHRQLDKGRRIAGLAQLNASLPDTVGNPLREEAFRRYCEALPFDGSSEQVRQEVIRLSIEKAHRWSGCR